MTCTSGRFIIRDISYTFVARGSHFALKGSKDRLVSRGYRNERLHVLSLSQDKDWLGGGGGLSEPSTQAQYLGGEATKSTAEIFPGSSQFRLCTPPENQMLPDWISASDFCVVLTERNIQLQALSDSLIIKHLKVDNTVLLSLHIWDLGAVAQSV
jgi:hypothetical protein